MRPTHAASPPLPDCDVTCVRLSLCDCSVVITAGR